jgi:putative membrane protein
MYGMDHGIGMLGHWALMLVLWLAPFVLLFVAIKLLLDRRWREPAKSAREILEEAYASGRIGREEFLRGREDLGK